jgi:hypothetical protein
VQLAHFLIDYNVICHQNWLLNDIYFAFYYAGDPPFLWRLWFNYKIKYHREKYGKIMTSGFEHILSVPCVFFDSVGRGCWLEARQGGDSCERRAGVLHDAVFSGFLFRGLQTASGECSL